MNITLALVLALGVEPEARPSSDVDALPAGAVTRLGTLRLRGVRGALTFTPDGKLLASAGGPAGADIVFWDPATGAAVRRLQTSSTIARLAFAPDGQRVLCFNNSSRTPVLDVASGKELFIVDGSHGVLSADGTLLVTGDAFGEASQVHVWDAASGRRLHQWRCGQGVMALAVAADNRTLALLDQAEPGAVQLRDLFTGARQRSVPVEAGTVFLAFSPDGKLLTAQRNGLTLWEPGTAKALQSWPQAVEAAPVFSPDGRQLAWSGRDERSRLRHWVATLDEAAPRALTTTLSHAYQSPCFTPDGKALAMVTAGGAVQIRTITDGQELLPLDAHASGIAGLALTPDGRHVVSRDSDEIIVWEARTGKLCRRFSPYWSTHELLTALLADGRLLTEDRTAQPTQGLFRLRDALTDRELLRFEGRPDVGPPCARVAPGGRHAALRGRAGEMCVLDLAAGRLVYRHQSRTACFGMWLSTDGDVLAWYTEPRGVEMHRRSESTGAVVTTSLPRDQTLGRWLGWHHGVSPDAHWLVSPVDDGRMRRWDLAAGKEVEELPDAPLSVWSLVWSPDSRLVAAHGSARLPVVRDRSARNYTLVWDVTSGKRVPHLDLPDDQSWRQFSADGRTILTTGPAGVTLWEVVTGRERLRLPARDAAALALSNDGRVLVTGGGDTQVLVWDLSGGHKEQALSAEQRRAAGEALAGGDAQAAYAALWQLVADPAGAITLLQEQLRPVKVRVDEKELSSLIARLGSDDFVDRQRATQQLETHGELALPALRQARQGSLSLEARRRVDGLLDKLDENRLHGVTLRGVRGVEVLERLGTAPARRLLNALAAGTPEARLTREAQAALARLAHAP